MFSLTSKLKTRSLPPFVLGMLAFASMLRADANAPLIVTLHPLLSEMVERVAGEHVRVKELMGPGGNPHTFEPKPGDLSRVQDAALVVAMGKNLETYLDRLQSALPQGTKIYEAGRLVPSLHLDKKSESAECCPGHSHGSVDPHWWQSPMAMHRATRHLGRQLEELLPEHRDEIRANTRAHMADLEELHEWVKSEVANVPRNRRILVTAHAAFEYFCEAYGFSSAPVRGLTAERDPSPGYMRETIDTIRRERVHAVFPEESANPTLLEMIREETGARLGETLYADNTTRSGTSYTEMIRHNVNAIVAALKD